MFLGEIMKYSISTMPILQRFNGNTYCALCDIKKTTDDQLVDQFLDEAVMEDHIRAKVNKLGFCEKHFDKLFEGQSKLGLALQYHTRLATISKKVAPIDNAKKAKKQAEELKQATSTCIICEMLEDHMSRYEETVCKMYSAEESFRNLLPKEKGICLNHYVNLLDQCAKAGKYADSLVKTLNDIQRKDINILSDEIRAFCDRFDYRNAGKPLGEEKFALAKTRIKFYGRK